MRVWPWIPRQSSVAPSQAFGFAVVGLGHGADKFLDALRASTSVRVAALVSGDRAKAERVARAYAVPTIYSYEGFDRIAEDPGVQAVYLCLPNAGHREFTERAALAGKHVLCEKPMATTVEDCHAMIEACQHANRLLMIGYRSSFNSVHQRARSIVLSGELGRVQAIRSGFGFRVKGGWRIDPESAGGGSLYDVGVYPIHLLHSLFEEEFTLSSATLTRAAGSGMEMEAAWQGAFASGATIHCRSSYLEKIPDFFEIEAELGTLTLQPAFSYSGLRLRVRARFEADQRTLNLDYKTPRSEPSAFRTEAESLARCVLHGVSVVTPGEAGLRDMQTITKIYEIASA